MNSRARITPESRANLVAELRLDLIEVDRELLVASHLAPCDVRDHLLMSRADAEFALVAILQSQQFRTEVAPAPGLLPQLRRLDGGHQDLLGTRRVHLLTHDGFDLSQYADAEWQPRVESGREQANQTGPEHQSMTDDFGLRRRFPHRREKRLRASHWRNSLGQLPNEIHVGGVVGRRRRTIGRNGSPRRTRLS